MNEVTIFSRKDCRTNLVKILRAGLDLKVEHIYGFEADDIEGQSPVIRIMSSSSDRPPLTARGVQSVFGITLQVLVLYKEGNEDPNVNNQWTPEDAEDRLDEIESQIAILLLYNTHYSKSNPIKSISYAGPTRIRKDVIGGETYLIEYIPLIVNMT